jgi:hypothetical protein
VESAAQDRLSLSQERRHFTDACFVKAFRAAILSMQTIDKVAEVSEFRYKQMLSRQLLLLVCCTSIASFERSSTPFFLLQIAHLLYVADPGKDASVLAEALRQHAPYLADQLGKEHYRSHGTSLVAQLGGGGAAGEDDDEQQPGLATDLGPASSLAPAVSGPAAQLLSHAVRYTALGAWEHLRPLLTAAERASLQSSFE